MQCSVAFLALACVLGAVCAASITSTPLTRSTKFDAARLRSRFRKQPALRHQVPGNSVLSASFLRGVMVHKSGSRMRQSARQTALPIDGNGLYEACREDDELQLIDNLIPCLGCLFEDEDCPSNCCAGFTTNGDDANQALLCEVGSCCIRVMVELDGDAVVYSNEPLRAMSRARGDYTCRDWEESRTCTACSLVVPDFDELEVLTCPYEMPKYTTIWDSVAECSSTSTDSGLPSPPGESTGGSTDTNEENERETESTAVPGIAIEDVRCRCTCT